MIQETPNEKAEELVNKFRQNQFGGCLICSDDFDDKYKSAKQCALIAVDEILSMYLCSGCQDCCVNTNYWQEVKQEIEKL